MSTKTPLKIFIASPRELEQERDLAILVLSRLNNAYQDLYLEPVRWEYAMIHGSFYDNKSFQEAITPKLQESEFAIFIFYSRLGVYTLEEFECAQNEKKKMLVFFKQGFLPVNDEQEENFKNLSDFKSNLNKSVVTIDFKTLRDFEFELFVNINLYLLEKITTEKNLNRSLNRHLTRTLIEPLASFNSRVYRFLNEARTKVTDWENIYNIRQRGEIEISSGFVGILGSQLSKVFSIGREGDSQDTQKRYIENCILTARISLQILCFIFISDFWNIRRENNVQVTAEQNDLLTAFFDTSFRPDISDYLNILKCLVDVYQKNQLRLPLIELPDLLHDADKSGHLLKSYEKISSLDQKLDALNFSRADCYEAEIYLTEILKDLVFLAGYKMISVKNIYYDQMRNMTPKYLHKFTALGIDTKSMENTEKLNYSQNPAPTEAVLLFKQNEDYQAAINLYPFIIDVNALTFESGSKICFYNCRDAQDDSLIFKFLGDSSDVNILFNNIMHGINDVNDIIADKDKRKKIKLDNVILQFNDARNTILSQ